MRARPPKGGSRSAAQDAEETYRLFIAVDLSEAAVTHLAHAIAGLHVVQARARVTARERWHVTLAFLGDVAVSRLEAVEKALHAAAGHARAFQLHIAGGGTFRSQVLWAGIAGDVDGLNILARLVRLELRKAKLPHDDRPYRPHLTLARPGDRVPPELLRQDVQTLAAYQGPSWPVTQVHLVRSFLGPHPRYERLVSAPLGAG